MANSTTLSPSRAIKSENTLAKRLREAPFDFSYYSISSHLFNPPTQNEINKMLDNALFPAPQLVEKAVELIRKPSTCGKKFYTGELVCSLKPNLSASGASAVGTIIAFCVVTALINPSIRTATSLQDVIVLPSFVTTIYRRRWFL
jgi:hypothetical protein